MDCDTSNTKNAIVIDDEPQPMKKRKCEEKKGKCIDVFGSDTEKGEKVDFWDKNPFVLNPYQNSEEEFSIEDEWDMDHQVVMTRDLLEEMVECWLEKHAVEVLRDVLASKNKKSFFSKK